MSRPQTVIVSDAIHPQLSIGKYLPALPAGNFIVRAFLLAVDYLVQLFPAPSNLQSRTVGIPSLDGSTEIPTFVARPKTASQAKGDLLPGILWIHGGGLVLGTYHLAFSKFSDLVDPHPSRLVDGAVVVSPNYRLAPAHPAPIPGDDCFAVYVWMVEHAEELGINTSRMVVGGESAGGGLAALLVQRILDHTRSHPDFPLPKSQYLIYPMLDDRTVSRVDAELASGYVAQSSYPLWGPSSNRYGWKSYLQGGAKKETVVPARREDLAGLPPAWIGVGSLDLFCKEDEEYARRLEEAGVEVTLEVVKGGWHGFDGACRGTEVVEAFKESHFRALKEALA